MTTMDTSSNRWTAADIPDQSGRIALVTGANSGLGLETARALAARGATVLLACRSVENGLAAREELLRATRLSGTILVHHLDLADLASVAAVAATVCERYGRLDLLINNAGVMATPRMLTRNGFELQFGTNHLGHFALTLALLPLLRDRPGARVVTVSSIAQHFARIAFDDLQGERRYDRWAAYNQSKLANMMFALELQRHLGSQGGVALSVAAHPGFARTNIQRYSFTTGSWIEPLAHRLLDRLSQGSAMGALPQLFAATSSMVRPGCYYGPSDWGGVRGWPVEARIASAALDTTKCRQLWEISQSLIASALIR